ncbi:protein of unknown function [Streptomyces sp. DvalAA-14]|uniref:DUF5133 domain-containing protein n=1 Tax=unclassified Streptomyces TaxID=2593676 RepID=UPI00081B472E|nr:MULTISPECIES: DUF5133 domain-containing protein [unclassified Streptomyces]MYS20465.1 DUF5133 domain-containing protein [Streptomyces sp. SID4948]SCD69495.1 protein of unknown function [Streptomyces sp. DvalAA-14]
MLMPHPATLQSLIRRYENLQDKVGAADCPEARRHLEDTVYTLCVSTGTRDVDEALRFAHRHCERPLETTGA